MDWSRNSRAEVHQQAIVQGQGVFPYGKVTPKVGREGKERNHGLHSQRAKHLILDTDITHTMFHQKVFVQSTHH